MKKKTAEEEQLAIARRLMRYKPLAIAPKSYRNRRRPSLHEAMRLEGEVLKDATLEKLGKSLVAKGYFSPHPWPWHVGFRD